MRAERLRMTMVQVGMGKRKTLKEYHLAWFFLTPTLLVLTVLVGWPVLYSLFLSIHEVVVRRGTMGYEPVGFRNYLGLFKDIRFQQALGQTVAYTVVQVIAVLVISMGLALLLNQGGFLSKLFKPISLVPWALSFVVNAVMWQWIYHGAFGLFNAVLLGLGLINEYHSWLSDPKWALPLIAFAGIWKAIPFPALVILAALKTVPEELMDAAKVDGADVWARFIHITLPWVRPVLMVVLVLQTMWSLKTFDIVWTLTQGGPMDKTMLLSIFAYQQSFIFFKYGYGSAAAYLISGLTLGLTIAYFKLLRGFEA